MDSNTIITIVIAVAGLAFALFALNRSRASSGTPKARPAEAPAMPAPAAAPRAAAPAAPRAPQVEAGIPPEVVAVIAAAVCAMGGGKYTLKAVRRAGRSAWARAGALDVTEPF